MLIYLEPSALFSNMPDADQQQGVLRRRTIRGLSDLSEAGHALYLSPGAELPAGIMQILAREDIDVRPAEASGNSPADARISGDVRELTVARTLKRGARDAEAETKVFSDWPAVVAYLLFPPRRAAVRRITRETSIEITVRLDGSGQHQIATGLGFYDHMLEQIARHGGVDLDIRCEGDLHIDAHHTIEDTGLALGDAMAQALGEKRGIQRYASCILPMDEARATVALDLSGRPYVVYEDQLRRNSVGAFPCEMTQHFFHSLAMSLKATLHAEVTGQNDHHQIEALFKAFAIALKQAVVRSGSSEIPSSKGVL